MTLSCSGRYNYYLALTPSRQIKQCGVLFEKKINFSPFFPLIFATLGDTVLQGIYIYLDVDARYFARIRCGHAVVVLWYVYIYYRAFAARTLYAYDDDGVCARTRPWDVSKRKKGKIKYGSSPCPPPPAPVRYRVQACGGPRPPRGTSSRVTTPLAECVRATIQ